MPASEKPAHELPLTLHNILGFALRGRPSVDIGSEQRPSHAALPTRGTVDRRPRRRP